MFNAVPSIQSARALSADTEPAQQPREEFIAPFAKARDEGRVLSEDETDDAILRLISRHHASDISKQGAIDAAQHVLRAFDHSVAGRRMLLMFIALADEWGR